MRLRAISVENVRCFTSPVRVEGISDGLNVLCEPNEYGKSTIFDAVQALFFKSHGSRDREVTALRPHAGGTPEVTVEVETPEGQFAISKRWLSRPTATVTQGGRLIAQAEAAETWIAQLVGGSNGGPSGLVWVRQGSSGLADGSRRDQEAALEARRDLLSSVTGEVEAMTGGRRMDIALSRCRAELAEYATGTGRPKAGGPWSDAQQRVEDLATRRDELAATVSTLHEALEQRKRSRRTLAELEDPDAVAERKVRLDAAVESRRVAERHAEDVEVEARKIASARLAVTSAQSRLETLRTAIAERRDAQEKAKAAADKATATRDIREAAEAALAKAQTELDAAQVAQKEAERARRLAQVQQTAREGAVRRTELQDRIAQAEEARQTMEEAAALANRGPNTAAMQKLELLAADLATATSARNASAAQLVMTYEPGRDGAVRLGDEPLVSKRPTAIPHGARLAIVAVGELEIRPAAEGLESESVESAEGALRAALEARGVADLESARTAAEAQAEAERRGNEAKAVFESIAPDGIDPLRAALARIPQVDETGDATDLTEAEAALVRTDEALVSAQSKREAAAERLADARSNAARAEAVEFGAQDRLRRALGALDRLGDTSEEGLVVELGRAAAELQEAERQHAEKSHAAPDLAAAEAALQRARSVDEDARNQIAKLKPDIARLDERISRSAGEAVEERLAETRQELEAAETELARIEREVAVLRRLEEALEAARTEARERYFAPVAAELKPLLQLLWPEAELTWEQDTLLPGALIRDGQREPIEILSGGTQEQVALLVRLAFARMLSRTGRHAPVILDDALVFTDDDRIERIFDALHRQAGELQILVFSCRQRAFRDLGGHPLRLKPLSTAETA